MGALAADIQTHRRQEKLAPAANILLQRKSRYLAQSGHWWSAPGCPLTGAKQTFANNKGIVAQGVLGEDGVFTASEVFAKHDENYMPPEVADALKQAGVWRHGEAAEEKVRQ